MNDKYAQKLKNFIQSLEEGGITKDELVKSIESVVNFVKEIKDNLSKELDKEKANTESQLNDIDNSISEITTVIDNLRIHIDRCMSDMEDSASEELTNMKELFDNEISDLKEDLQEKTDFKHLEDRITVLENKEDPEIPEIDILDIRNRFEVLSEDEKLDKSAIRGLIDDLKRLEKKIDDKVVTGGTGGVTNLRIQQAFKYILKTESPTGLIDGSNTTYTVKNDIFAVLSFSANGETIAQLPNYTISGRTITFSSPLPSAYSGKDFEIKYI